MQRSQDRVSLEDMDGKETEPMSNFVQSNGNILEGTNIPEKDVEITKDVQTQGENHVSPTYRSSLMPYSFNITQRQGDYQTLPATKTSGSPVKQLQKMVHDQLKDSQAKGVLENFLSPVQLKGSIKSQMGMLSNKGANYMGGIAGVANGWSTNTNFTNYNDTQAALGRTTRNRSILTSGIENKFELNANTSGQTIGGPERKTNITMWDLMTLYDTKKKRIEDEAAFRAHK